MPAPFKNICICVCCVWCMYIFWRCESLECLSAPRWQTQSHKFQRTSVNRSRGAHNKSHGKRFRHFYPQKGTLGHTFGFLTFHLASTKFLRHLLKIIYHFPEFSEWNFGKTTTTFLWLKVLSNRFYGHLKFFGGAIFVIVICRKLLKFHGRTLTRWEGGACGNTSTLKCH